MQFPDPASLLQQAAAALPEAFIDRRLVARASLALEQLGSVVGEVRHQGRPVLPGCTSGDAP